MGASRPPSAPSCAPVVSTGTRDRCHSTTNTRKRLKPGIRDYGPPRQRATHHSIDHELAAHGVLHILDLQVDLLRRQRRKRTARPHPPRSDTHCAHAPPPRTPSAQPPAPSPACVPAMADEIPATKRLRDASCGEHRNRGPASVHSLRPCLPAFGALRTGSCGGTDYYTIIVLPVVRYRGGDAG